MKSRYQETTKIFKSLSDCNRLMIIEMLLNGERCACTLLEDINISQSTLSHHMKILCESEIVNCRRDGKWMYYSLNTKGCEIAHKLLTEVIESSVVNKDNGEKCDCI